MEDDTKTRSVVFHVASGILVFLATVLYVKYHRGTASEAALAYAAKIRQQQQEEQRKKAKETQDEKKENTEPLRSRPPKPFQFDDHTSMVCLPVTTTTTLTAQKEEEKEEVEEVKEDSLARRNNYGFQCACGQGFIPPGLVKTLGGAEAIFRMGAGQCYHKQF